jgi:long-chain fatty acid transport protein
VGLGINSPLNFEIEWPQTAEMEHVVYILNKMEIRSLAISPAVAVKLSENFSLGAGINMNFYRTNLRYHYRYSTQSMVAMLTNGQVRDCPDTVIDLSDFKTNSIGFFAGLQFKPTSIVTIGAAYRRGAPLAFESGIVNAWEPEIDNAYASAKLAEIFPDSPEQSAEISLAIVDQISAGIALDIGSSLDLEFDLTWVLWSQMENFDIDYALNTMYRIPFWNAMFDIESTTHFRNTVSAQLGVEYKLTSDIDLRLGAFYHGSPVVIPYLSPAFPLADKMGLSAGVGYRVGRFNVDAAYVFNSLSELEADNSLFSRWGDTSQKYLSRKDNVLMINAGIRF